MKIFSIKVTLAVRTCPLSEVLPRILNSSGVFSKQPCCKSSYKFFYISLFFYSVYFPCSIYRHLLFPPYPPTTNNCLLCQLLSDSAFSENLKQLRTQCCHPINIIFWLCVLQDKSCRTLGVPGSHCGNTTSVFQQHELSLLPAVGILRAELITSLYYKAWESCIWKGILQFKTE